MIWQIAKIDGRSVKSVVRIFKGKPDKQVESMCLKMKEVQE